MVLHDVFRAFGWIKDKETEEPNAVQNDKDNQKMMKVTMEDRANRDEGTKDSSSMLDGPIVDSTAADEENGSLEKPALPDIVPSMPEAREGISVDDDGSAVVAQTTNSTACSSSSPREKKSVSSQESAVATDVTALATEPSYSPSSSKIRTIDMAVSAIPSLSDELLAACDDDNNDDDDMPEDLPVFIRTAPPKRRSKSVSSRCSRPASVRDDPSQAGGTAATNTTALATSIGLKHEAIVQAFSDIIQELDLPVVKEEESETEGPSVRQQLDQAMNDQRVLINELQEVISRLETDARREEAENAKLKRRLQSASRRGTSAAQSQKSKARRRPRPRSKATGSSTPSRAKTTKPSPQQSQQKPGFVFPVSEITCSQQDVSFEDDLTWFDALNAPPRKAPSRGYEC